MPSMPLAELNARSAKLGEWDVVVFWPEMVPYNHKWGTGHVFKCVLVSITDPNIAGCSLQDLMFAQMASLQESMDILPEKSDYYELRAVLYGLMANIHDTVMHGSFTLESFEDLRSAVVTLKSRCTPVSVR